MHSRFSKHAQAVLAKARSQSERQGFSSPLAWHILQAVLQEKGGGAAVLFRRAGVDPIELRKAVEEVPPVAADDTSEGGCWSELLDAALSEARQLGQESAGTAHLLLGILKNGRSQASGILKRFGLELSRSRQLLLTSSGERGPSNRAASSAQRPNLLAVAAQWHSHTESSDSKAAVKRPYLEEKIVAAFSRSQSPNVVVTGSKGSGRHSIIAHAADRLSQLVAAGQETPVSVLQVELFRLVGWRWQRAQKKLSEFVEEITRPGPFVLVIDDIDLFAGTRHWQEAALILRLILSKSAFPIAFVCEWATYKDCVKPDPYLSNRLITINVPQPRGEEAYRILGNSRERLEAFHGLRITDEALTQSLESAARIGEKEDLELARSFLDHAAANVRAKQHVHSDHTITAIEQRLSELIEEKKAAVEVQDYGRAARIRDEESELRKQKLEYALSEEPGSNPHVGANEVQEAVESMYGDPKRGVKAESEAGETAN